MKRCLLIVLFAGIFGLHLTAGEVGFMNISREIVVPESWNPPEFVIRDGRVFFKPATPNLVTRRVGTQIRILDCVVHRFMINIKPDFKKVEPGTVIKSKRGKPIKLKDRDYQLIGGDLFKVLGRLDDHIVFKHMKSRNVALAQIAESKEESESGKDS